MMPLGLWIVVGWMALVALIALLLFWWGWRTGQFKDVEKAKYRMLEDIDPQPWPGRDNDKGGSE